MDDKKRWKLIIDLTFEGVFDSNYSEDNRLWFLEKVIRGFEAEGVADSIMEQKTREVVQKAKTVVTANRDFTLKLVADGNPRFTKRLLESFRRHRVEILYGAIAFHREFIEPAHLDYLLFIAKRRFRTICRMYTWVNPNILAGKREGYFAYPDECPGDQRWRVNEDAQASWQRKTSKDIPIEMKPGVDPVVGINKVFAKRTSDACKGNLFDCAVTAEIVIVDSLLEAKDSTIFLIALPPAYLEINHIRRSEFAKSPIDVKNVLERVPLPMPVRDFQVGDHCYIYNHPLYKEFRPTGSWTGEFAFVYSCGDRNLRSKKGFVFGGHGMNGTLFQFYNRFVNELSTYLALVRKLSAVHLAFMRGGAAAIAPGTVSESEEDIEVFDVISDSYKPAARYRLIEYTKVVEVRDFEKVPTKTKRKPKTKLPGFLILQSKTDHVFYLALVDSPNPKKPLDQNLKKKTSDILPTKKVRYPIKFARLKAPSGLDTPSVIYAIDKWGVAYQDHVSQTEKTWAFYVVVGGTRERHELRNDKNEIDPQLFDSPFSRFTSKGTDIKVDLPRIDFGPHQAFLQSNDAF